jgi:hypothetical protein
MDEAAFQPPPKILEAIMASTRELGFQSWCWPQVGALPRGRTFAASTSIGRAASW